MESTFDKHKILHGLPLPGQKIRYANPSKWSFHTNILEDEKNLLELGKEYTVKETELNSSSTYVFLEEFWDGNIDQYYQNQKCFNMYAFEWEKPKIVLDDLIGLDTRSVARLNRFYNMGIKFDGEVFYEGFPMLVLEYDEHDLVTKAYYEKID